LYESKSDVNNFSEIIDYLVNLFNLNSENIEILSVSKSYKHILSHQKIYAKFFTINIKKPYIYSDISENSYSIKEILALPKPILIDNYLKEYIF